MFRFVGYDFDKNTFVANFRYADEDGLFFTETVHFKKNIDYSPALDEVLDRALKLSFLLAGTSYYKAHPTRGAVLPFEIDRFTAKFLNLVYNEGLSQFAFENNLTRKDLVSFKPTLEEDLTKVALPFGQGRVLALQSGGKDSILTATLLDEEEKDWVAFYAGSTSNHPEVIDEISPAVDHVIREVDINGLNAASARPGYLNGHVPVTFILMSYALIQAILDHRSIIITSIGHEGEEPHSIISDSEAGDLAVNHQWSKTWTAEKYFAEYVHRYISSEIQVGSLLRGYSELRIAELFSEKCWAKYGHSFSSCNVANYRQKVDNTKLTWCGECAKCANSFLIFAPFVPAEDLVALFGNDLFKNPKLVEDFKGLLGVDGAKKPFECVGEVNELREAYHKKLEGYADLPFEVPVPQGFSYKNEYPVQDFVKNFSKI